MVVETLATVALPAAWKQDLREQLRQAEPAEWLGIIDREKRKAGAAPARAAVTGAGQQVAASEPPTPATPVPLPGEDVAAWKARLTHRR
jgi:hypothetical protein